MALLRSINSFYRKGPKLTRELIKTAEALDEKVLSFKPICETKGANSLKSTLTAINTNYTSIVQHLTNIVTMYSNDNTSSVKSTEKGILKDILSYENLHFIHVY